MYKPYIVESLLFTILFRPIQHRLDVVHRQDFLEAACQHWQEGALTWSDLERLTGSVTGEAAADEFRYGLGVAFVPRNQLLLFAKPACVSGKKDLGLLRALAPDIADSVEQCVGKGNLVDGVKYRLDRCVSGLVTGSEQWAAIEGRIAFPLRLEQPRPGSAP
jgi:hypothetical protein